MQKEEIYKSLVEILGEDKVSADEDMSRRSSFETGGLADVFVTPSSKEEISETLKFINDNGIELTIIGNGTNLLIRDKGIRGVTMSLYDNFNFVKVEENMVFSQAGALISAVANYACRAGLSGLEFASGIPGTIGGAVKINAGAYDYEIKDVFHSAILVKKNGDMKEVFLDDMEFAYRHSAINDELIAEVTLELEEGDTQKIRQKMVELNKRRKEKQPINMPSAGSTFKRPKGHYAGKLIEEAGLKGFQIGGARVSIKHCGFVVNTGDATSADIENLIEKIQKVVYDNSGVKLETEVLILGEK
jgi:UDP-N-acetylmuramate dehydrogenase